MKLIKAILLPTLLVVFSLLIVGYMSVGEKGNFPETVKIALRDSGNRLLLANSDTSSLVLPVLQLDQNRFELSFGKDLAIIPDSLVKIIGRSLKTMALPKNYIVEVINCSNGEVAYSYQMNKNVENNIIPCVGRDLPSSCYMIQVLFTKPNPFFGLNNEYSLLSLLIIGFVSAGLLYRKRQGDDQERDHGSISTAIGNYRFYATQNKLVKDDTVIKLTLKECELIRIFSEHPNKVVKREILMKKVWEDNGVFVGRSLDTFISKLRRKFKDDDSISINNVHGVGYVLEISENRK